MEVEEFLKEAAVMKEIKHPNLVQLLGMSTFSKEALYLYHITCVWRENIFLGSEERLTRVFLRCR